MSRCSRKCWENKVWGGNITITVTRSQNKDEKTQRETELEVIIDLYGEKKEKDKG